MCEKIEFEKCGDKEFFEMFMKIMRSGDKNNTYKFALARFLLEYSANNTETSVRYSNIAHYFFRYYWTQCRSGLRQGPDNQRLKIITIIENEFPKSYYSRTFDWIKRKFPDRVDRCLELIPKQCFNNVIHRFQAVGGVEHRIFYNYCARVYRSNNATIDPNGGILLNPHAMDFFRRNHSLLFFTTILWWVKFVERRNFGVRNLASKVEHASCVRDQRRFKNILKSFMTECFYCKEPLEPTNTHVEHVIPFGYICESELWNLVLACQECNCRKQGNLPPRKYIDELIKRNKKYRKQNDKLNASLRYLESDSHDFDAGIIKHYNDAMSFGFYVPTDFPCKT